MKVNHYEKILAVLIELKETFPTYNLGRHIETALDGYKDVWGMTDKEMHWALIRYKAQLTMDVSLIQMNLKIDKIIKDGMQLHNILHEDEEDLD